MSHECQPFETEVNSDDFAPDHHPLPNDAGLVVAEELRGATINKAEDAYIGRRRSEANGPFSSGTMRARACRTYGRVLTVDREARSRLDDAVAGLVTLAIDPSKTGVTSPVETVDAVRDGMSACSRRICDRVGRDYVAIVGIREFDSNGVPHAHLHVVGDGNRVDKSDLHAGVGAHIRSTPGAVDDDHQFDLAVGWDQHPTETAQKKTEQDEEHGPVHPRARYSATGLPHLSELGKMDSHEITQGALEWASGSSSTLFAGVARDVS